LFLLYPRKYRQIFLSNDHYLHDFININSLNAFIGEPQLVSQGSINNLNNKFYSSIWHTTDNDDLYNPNYKCE
jgi:hypothetical protein